MSRRAGWTMLIVANVLFYCMLSFYQASDAAPSKTKLPFANAVEQRFEMIGQLKEIRSLLREQNALIREELTLLRSANPKVAVGEPERR